MKMREFFHKVWDDRQDKEGFCYCFEVGCSLHRTKYRDMPICFDHVLEKELFPQYKFVEKNIIIVSPDTHYRKGELTPKIMVYRAYLLDLHKKGEL